MSFQNKKKADVIYEDSDLLIVRKPSGALPGKVIYTDHKTMLAESDGALAERLKR